MTDPNGWDGNERRRDNLEFHSAMDDIRKLRDTVVNVAATVGPLVERVALFPAREEVEAKIGAVRDDQKMWTQRFAVIAAAVLVGTILNIVMVVQHRHQAATKVQNSLLCLLEQLSEHRDANEEAHHEIAGKVGGAYVVPKGEEPIRVPIELRAKCRDFLPNGGAERR